MDRHVDYLTLQTGGKVELPFECFLIFSTNLRPDQLGDEAFLRRLSYKTLMRNPEEWEFAEIFRRFCAANGLASDDGLLARFLQKHYRDTGRPMRRCHPRDVLSHAIDLMHFERLPSVLTDEILDVAFESCFVDAAASEEG